MQEIIDRYSENIACVIVKTRPSPDELRQLIKNELQKFFIEYANSIIDRVEKENGYAQ
jgi:hypothetical protein